MASPSVSGQGADAEAMNSSLATDKGLEVLDTSSTSQTLQSASVATLVQRAEKLTPEPGKSWWPGSAG